MRLCIAIFFIISLSACRQTMPPKDVASQIRQSDSIPQVNNKTIDTVSDVICTGAAPDFKIVDTIRYPAQVFHYDQKKRTGYTTFITSEGDSITIAFSNCIASIFEFTINTAMISAELLDTTSLVNYSSKVMQEIKPAVKIPINLDSAAYYLRNFYATKGVALNEQIHFDEENSFPEFIELNSIDQNNNRRIIKLTLWRDM